MAGSTVMASPTRRRMRRSRPVAWNESITAARGNLSSKYRWRRTSSLLWSALMTSSRMIVSNTMPAAATLRPGGVTTGTADTCTEAFLQPLVPRTTRSSAPKSSRSKRTLPRSSCTLRGRRPYHPMFAVRSSTDDGNDILPEKETKSAAEPKPKRGRGRPKKVSNASGSAASEPAGGCGRGRGRGGGRRAQVTGPGRGRGRRRKADVEAASMADLSSMCTAEKLEEEIVHLDSSGSLQRKDLSRRQSPAIGAHEGDASASGGEDEEEEEEEEAGKFGLSELRKLEMISIGVEQVQKMQRDYSSTPSAGIRSSKAKETQKQKSIKNYGVEANDAGEMNGTVRVNGAVKINGAGRRKRTSKVNGEDGAHTKADSNHETGLNGAAGIVDVEKDTSKKMSVKAAGGVEGEALRNAIPSTPARATRKTRVKGASVAEAKGVVDGANIALKDIKSTVNRSFALGDHDDGNAGSSDGYAAYPARDILLREALPPERSRQATEEYVDDPRSSDTEQFSSLEELWAEWEGGEDGLEYGREGDGREKSAEGDDDDDEDVEKRLPTALELCVRLSQLIGEEFGGESKGTDSSTRENTQGFDVSDEEDASDALANPELRHVMVVFGKHLIRDQITVEYASRIRRLVQGIKSGNLKPDLVCFTGGRVRDNYVADASAGYLFFRQLCEHQQVDISELRFLVESESTCTKEAMRNVVREVARLEQEERYYLEDEGGRPQISPRLQYHFTLISNEYHLSRMNVVDRLSPGVSLLAPLKALGASCGYELVPYPYACCSDEGTKFQSDVYKTLEELVPLQVNVQAVASMQEFFQEENYKALVHVRQMLAEYIRQLHSSRVPLALHMHLADLKRAAEQGRRGKMGTSPAGNMANMPLDEALEWAAGALGKIEEIIEPAATRRDSVSLRAWAMCAALIEKAVRQGQMAADPDRPLKVAEWTVIEDDKAEPPPMQNQTIPELSHEVLTSVFNSEQGGEADVEDDDGEDGDDDDDDDDDESGIQNLELLRKFLAEDDEEEDRETGEEAGQGRVTEGKNAFNPWNREPFVPRSQKRRPRVGKEGDGDCDVDDEATGTYEFGFGVDGDELGDAILTEKGGQRHDGNGGEENGHFDDLDGVQLSVLDVPGFEWMRDDDDDDDDERQQQSQENTGSGDFASFPPHSLPPQARGQKSAAAMGGRGEGEWSVDAEGVPPQPKVEVRDVLQRAKLRSGAARETAVQARRG